MEWLTNDMIFYGGLIIAAFSLLTTLVCFFIFKIKKMNLNVRLDAEYGKNAKIKNKNKKDSQ